MKSGKEARNYGYAYENDLKKYNNSIPSEETTYPIKCREVEAEAQKIYCKYKTKKGEMKDLLQVQLLLVENVVEIHGYHPCGSSLVYPPDVCNRCNLRLCKYQLDKSNNIEVYIHKSSQYDCWRIFRVCKECGKCWTWWDTDPN